MNVRRIACLVLPAAVVAATAGPALGADRPIDARLRDVRLTAAGSVRVSFDYRCPGNDAYRVLRFPSTQLTVLQSDLSGSVYQDEPIRRAIVCDGTTHGVVRTVAPPAGERFDPGLLLEVTLRLAVEIGGDPLQPLEAGELEAGEIDTFSLATTGSAMRAADLHIRRTRFSDRRGLAIRLVYWCPSGWFVNVVDDADWADVIGRQGPLGSSDTSFWKPIGEEVVCDGSANSIVVRVKDGDWRGRFSPDHPVLLVAKMILHRVHGDGSMSSYQGVTVRV